MEDIAMKRKPKMHNEHEFDVDNIYQEDDRQLDIMEDSLFDITNQWDRKGCNTASTLL